jgi:hypothetical protein
VSGKEEEGFFHEKHTITEELAPGEASGRIWRIRKKHHQGEFIGGHNVIILSR